MKVSVSGSRGLAERGKLDAALEKYGSASAAILAERFEMWPIGEAMQLMAMGAREAAELVIKTREANSSQ